YFHELALILVMILAFYLLKRRSDFKATLVDALFVGTTIYVLSSIVFITYADIEGQTGMDYSKIGDILHVLITIPIAIIFGMFASFIISLLFFNLWKRNKA